MAGKTRLLKVEYHSLRLGCTERENWLYDSQRKELISGSGSGCASECDNVSISHFYIEFYS